MKVRKNSVLLVIIQLPPSSEVPLVDAVEHTTVSIGYGCLILQIDVL